jgi:hypothetical protein
MQATRSFVQNQPADATPAATATAFGAYCTQNEVLKQSALCSKVQAAITASTFGNLGRRAAGLCMRLELCDRTMGANCNMQVAIGNTSVVVVSTANLDVCSGMSPAAGMEVMLLPQSVHKCATSNTGVNNRHRRCRRWSWSEA